MTVEWNKYIETDGGPKLPSGIKPIYDINNTKVKILTLRGLNQPWKTKTIKQQIDPFIMYSADYDSQLFGIPTFKLV